MRRLTRRDLPSIQLLMAFESAARSQSFTFSAVELNLTQSAVSRQIRDLEALLGTALFVRERQKVRLTAAGDAYAREVRHALHKVADATLGFRARPQAGALRLAILPTFGTRWLAPRLGAFLAAHPGITVNLSTRLAPFDFVAEPIDAAIHFGAAEWPGARLDFLMKETLAPACSPLLREDCRLKQPRDLLRAPLVHLASRPFAWEHWLRASGVAVSAVPGMLVDQFAVATQVAVSGLGVALLPRFLIDAELARGELVIAAGQPLESADRYYLAWPGSRENHAPLQAFRRWLLGAVKAVA